MLRCVRIFAAIGFLFAAAGSAQAGDRWNGFYLGANVGWGSAESDGNGNIKVYNDRTGTQYPTGPLPYSIDRDGAFGGLQAGYNLRSGDLFAGIEADIQTADISGSSTTGFSTPVPISPFVYSASASTDWFATVRGRIGLANKDTLAYLTGGFAIGDVDYRATYLIPGNGAFANLSSSERQTGYVVGGGIEKALTRNLSLKLEYQFIDLGKQSAEGALFFSPGNPSGETVRTTFDTEIHTVRLGLNYHFDWHPAY
jgi:outer membrane immunogenic protein